MNKDKCAGCHNNFYNGNNEMGIEECWCLESAKLILRKEVSIRQIPPWNQKAKKFPSCYRRPGYVYVEPDAQF